MRKKAFIVVALILVLFFLAVEYNKASENTQKPTRATEQSQEKSPLIIKVLDIGQGDAILIKADGKIVLVDTGDIGQREKLVALLKKEKVSTIDILVITHPHSDHLGGVPAIFENFKVGQIYDSGRTNTTALYKQYLTGVSKKKIPFEIAKPGVVIPIAGDIKLKVLASGKSLPDDPDLNNGSIVAKLTFNQFSMLLTGDAEKESEAHMLEKYSKDLKSDVLKSPHHGSRSSSTANFLKQVKPAAVIISLAAQNDYNHPHPSVMERYKKAKIDIYRTDLDGSITIASNGKNFTIQREKRGGVVNY